MKRKELEKLVSVELGWENFDLIDVYDNVWKVTKLHYLRPNWFYLNQHSQLLKIRDNDILIRRYDNDHFDCISAIFQKRCRYLR
jgi:hypothetical protein